METTFPPPLAALPGPRCPCRTQSLHVSLQPGGCWGHTLPPGLSDPSHGPHYPPPRDLGGAQPARGRARGRPSASEPRRAVRGSGKGRGRFPAAGGGRYLAEHEEPVGRQPDGGGDGAERAELQARAAHGQLPAGGAVLAAPQRDRRPRRRAVPPLLHAAAPEHRAAAGSGPPASRVPPSHTLPAPRSPRERVGGAARRGGAGPLLPAFPERGAAGGEGAAVPQEPELG